MCVVGPGVGPGIGPGRPRAEASASEMTQRAEHVEESNDMLRKQVEALAGNDGQ
jgi:hypothetical protein